MIETYSRRVSDDFERKKWSVPVATGLREDGDITIHELRHRERRR